MNTYQLLMLDNSIETVVADNAYTALRVANAQWGQVQMVKGIMELKSNYSAV